MTRNPYRNLEDYHFWSRAMSWPAPGQIDPMVGSQQILLSDRVATMGSCFAQHLSRYRAELGFNYHVTEPAPAGMSAEEARRRNYRVFSARFGNVYTVRQAVQLYQRAFGQFEPKDDVWEASGGFVDAFRPQIEPVPHPTPAAVRTEARAHLACVREMFESADWLIFTLGLTEGWRSLDDGAVYPTAPGVAGGSYDPHRYEFVNFSAAEVLADLARLIGDVRHINPSCRIILTVSPVPLIATFENRHVWTATTYSKAVLRVAAEEVQLNFPNVIYFPSYEIITSPAAGGGYYADDLRSVTDLGVKHVMRVFRKHFVEAAVAPPQARPLPAAAPGTAPGGNNDVICDEEVIEKSIRLSGVALSPEGTAASPGRGNS